MKTFIAATFGLLPLIVFWVLMKAGPSDLAIPLALALAAITTGWRLWSRTATSLEIAVLALFTLLGLGRLGGASWATRYAVPTSFIGLGLFSLGGAVLGKPWTAEYARSEYADVAHTPEFGIVNRTITVILGVILLFFALARLLGLGVWPTAIGGVLGGIACVVGAKLLMRAALRQTP